VVTGSLLFPEGGSTACGITAPIRYPTLIRISSYR
jgi:hypothetical protein